MSLTATRHSGEELLTVSLVTPRNPERAAQLASRVRAREARPVKKPTRVFFDPENQPRGQRGKLPPDPVKLPVIIGSKKRPGHGPETRRPKAVAPVVYEILNAICSAYKLDPIDLMDGKGQACGAARWEAYYTLMTACNLSSRDVGRLMRRRGRSVLAGAHRHAGLHGLPITWTRGPRGRGAE